MCRQRAYARLIRRCDGGLTATILIESKRPNYNLMAIEFLYPGCGGGTNGCTSALVALKSKVLGNTRRRFHLYNRWQLNFASLLQQRPASHQRLQRRLSTVMMTRTTLSLSSIRAVAVKAERIFRRAHVDRGSTMGRQRCTGLHGRTTWPWSNILHHVTSKLVSLTAQETRLFIARLAVARFRRAVY